MPHVALDAVNPFVHPIYHVYIVSIVVLSPPPHLTIFLAIILILLSPTSVLFIPFCRLQSFPSNPKTPDASQKRNTTKDTPRHCLTSRVDFSSNGEETAR